MSKEVPFAPFFGERITSPKFRVSYPYLHLPNTKENFPRSRYPSGKYELQALFPKDTDLSALKEACEHTAKNTDGWDGVAKEDIVFPMRDGDEREETKGYWVLKLKAFKDKKPDTVRKVDGKFFAMAPKEIYGGCWARASMTPLSYEASETVVDAVTKKRVTVVKRGISLALNNVMFVADGEKFVGKGGSATSDFADSEDSEVGQEGSEGPW